MCEIPDEVVLRLEGPGEVVALFPFIPATSYREAPSWCECYAHIGQHSAADYFGVVAHSEPIDENDPLAKALLNELRGIGYNLKIIKRLPWNWRQRIK